MIIFVKGTRAYAIFTRVDRFFAGLIGMRFGSQYTISAQCYRSTCRACRWLGKLLDFIQKDHFKIAADLEDLKE